MTAADRPDEHIPSKQLRYRLAELTRDNTELKKFNRALTAEREVLTKKWDDCSRLVDASATGLISLDKSGLIEQINACAVKMLGADKAYLLKKPIGLFITPEDQADFYINRSRIFSGSRKQPFEIMFRKKDGTRWSARVNAQPVETPGRQLPGMLLAVEDITAYRQALEALQLKAYSVNLLFSILEDLSGWPAADIDDIITGSLEKVGVAANADRVYVCLLHDGKRRLSVTHEWLGSQIESPAQALRGAAAESFSGILAQAKRYGTVAVAHMDMLAPENRAAHDSFHPPAVKSILFTPLTYDRTLLGIIGCDAVRQPVDWSQDTRNMVKCVGGAIVNALVRRQAGKTPTALRTRLLQLVDPAPHFDGSTPLEYDGPIEWIDDSVGQTDRTDTHWRFEAGEPDHPDLLATALLKDGKTATIACKHCNRQQQLDISEIRTIGTRLKATCTCGKFMYVKVELRCEQRKAVDLDGVFIRGRGDRPALKSGDWGQIRITNLSRHGLGLRVFGRQEMRLNDRFRVKFTLDNTANSMVQKEVVVRSVTEGAVGCQFVGKDPCDVTLGFYLIT